MANTATTLTAIPMAMASGQQGFSQVTPVVCTFDTVDSDLTVFTPALTTHYAAIVGMLYEEASAHTLTIKSDTTTLVTLERSAYEGVGLPLGTSGFIVVGALGKALKIRCGTAAVSSMLLYCVEFPSLNFHGKA